MKNSEKNEKIYGKMILYFYYNSERNNLFKTLENYTDNSYKHFLDELKFLKY